MFSEEDGPKNLIPCSIVFGYTLFRKEGSSPGWSPTGQVAWQRPVGSSRNTLPSRRPGKIHAVPGATLQKNLSEAAILWFVGPSGRQSPDGQGERLHLAANCRPDPTIGAEEDCFHFRDRTPFGWLVRRRGHVLKALTRCRHQPAGWTEYDSRAVVVVVCGDPAVRPELGPHRSTGAKGQGEISCDGKFGTWGEVARLARERPSGLGLKQAKSSADSLGHFVGC